MTVNDIILADDGVFYGAVRTDVHIIKDHAVLDVCEWLDRDVVADAC